VNIICRHAKAEILQDPTIASEQTVAPSGSTPFIQQTALTLWCDRSLDNIHHMHHQFPWTSWRGDFLRSL